MNFLGMGTVEILVIFLIAFIFLGPERMVDVARTLGKTLRQLRRFSTDISETFMDEDAFGLLDRPIVHQRGGRGHFETENSPQGEARSDSPEPDGEPDGPVDFKPTSQTPEEEKREESPEEPSGASPSGVSPSGASKEEKRA
jgi:Sec-independent protein translocase protein TatA